MNKKIVYFDMDNVLVDFQSGIDKLNFCDKVMYEGKYDEHPYIFQMMEQMEGAVTSFIALSEKYDCYILSTAPWGNPAAWKQKREWIESYLGEYGKKRLILSHNKNLMIGDYLIDDRTANGAGEFKGEHIHFGTDSRFMDWNQVTSYLMRRF